MQTSLLEILRSIPVRRRREGRRQIEPQERLQRVESGGS